MNKFVVRLPVGSNAPSSGSEHKAAKSQVQKPLKKTSTCTQMYLDLGQKSFGKTQTCKLCGMFYVKDDTLDCKNHEEFCRKRARPLMFPNLLGHHVVQEFKDEQKCVIYASRKDALHNTVVEELLALVARELGNCNDLVKEFDSIYILLDKSHTVLGCVVCEKVVSTRCARVKSSEDAALHLVQQRDRSQDIAAPSTHTAAKYGKKRNLPVAIECNVDEIQRKKQNTKLAEELLSASTEIHRKLGATSASDGFIEVLVSSEVKTDSVVTPDCAKQLMGIKLIWVSPQHRRQRVAHTLLDTARRCFIFGTVMAVADVVFSQPTEDGFAFASAYCQTDTVYAYA